MLEGTGTCLLTIHCLDRIAETVSGRRENGLLTSGCLKCCVEIRTQTKLPEPSICDRIHIAQRRHILQGIKYVYEISALTVDTMIRDEQQSSGSGRGGSLAKVARFPSGVGEDSITSSRCVFRRPSISPIDDDPCVSYTRQH